MSEDTKSSHAKRTVQRKILIIANPDDIDNSSDEDHIPPSQPSYSTLPHTPSILPLPSSSSRSPRHFHSPYPPLRTDLPHYPSSQSNPPLSSPSSNSSAAIESTPPPSTPGQSVPPVDLTGSSFFKLRPQPPKEREHTHTFRPSALVPKLWPHRRSSSNRRTESESLHSPSPSCPSPTSSVSVPIDNIFLMVTSDCHTYKTVDISGARNVAFVRERMFTELQISDEDQAVVSIYRTEIGKYAIGDPLSDEQLFRCIRELGDRNGTLKFFICVSGARVHELQLSLPTSPISSIPPPPVLPISYGPLKPRVRKPRHGSVSSEDPTADTGYEPSVSDDVEYDNRSTMRPSQLPIAAVQNIQPNSPRPVRYEDRNLSLSSPISIKPISGSAERGRDHETRAPSNEQSIVQSLPDSYNEAYLNAHTKHARKVSDAEREKALLESEDVLQRAADYALKQKVEKSGRTFFGKRRERFPSDEDVLERKPREDTWVVVPNDRDTPAEVSKPSPSRQSNKKRSTRDDPLSPRRGGQQVPFSYLPWHKPQTKSSPWPLMQGGKTLKGTMSVENLRPQHPKILQPGPILRPSPSRPQLNQVSIPSSISNTYITGSTSTGDFGTRYPRPLPPNPTIDTTNSSTSQTVRPHPHSPPSSNNSALLSPQDPYPRPHSASPSQSSHPNARNKEAPSDRESARPSHRLQPSQTSIRSSPSEELISRHYARSESCRTPPRSPNQSRPSTATSTRSFTYGPSPTLTPSSAIDGQGTMNSDATIRPEDRDKILDFMGSGEATLNANAWRNARRRSSTSPVGAPSNQSSTTLFDGMSTMSTYSENGTAGLWSTPMKDILLRELKTPTACSRPPLTVDTNPSTPAPSRADPLPAARPRPRTPKDQKRKTFEDFTWAPRPPPEDVYNRLEEFFPEHDLDRPVIEAGSGGTSPTTLEHPSVVLPAVDRERGLVKGKKSIRIVAEEHKKRIDRVSRAESYSNVIRKRSTKLWDSRLVEVTTSQSKTNLNRVLPESPSGGPKPIFKWVRGELIGKGTYGRVYLALNATTGEMIAVKQVEMPTTASDRNDTRQVNLVQALKMESETLKDLDHANIVQYLGFEETPNFLSIFLEYVPGGSIGSCLQKHGKFDEEVTKSFTSQILGGLEYLHSKNILHRDLKADNILVETSGVCKISDFGISKRTDDINGGAHTAMQGTIFWMAPEVINSEKGKGYNSKIDIWSVGCVVLEMWAGKRPWEELEAVTVMLKLFSTKQAPPVPEGVTLTRIAKDFKDKCFAEDPNDRPSAAELRLHPYLELPDGWTFDDFK